ncbi:MAG: peptide chain release factor N(5)-glutamine methyltransferase [Acutalibacteraceae bacterium]
MASETYRALLRQGEQYLQNAAVQDAAFEARCLLEAVCGTDRTGLIMLYAQAVPEKVRTAYSEKLRLRADGQPLQYILGEWDFMGHTFSVQPGVLIPRTETEFLAEWAIRHLPQNAVLYDVCAGTGCIGISVALERRDVQVYLFEKYDAPFQCLSENIRLLNVQNVTAIQRDMFDGVPEGVPMPQGIVSNPPYIRTRELPTLQKEVQKEPVEALDGGEDGLLFYRALREKWYPKIQNGFLAMECGEAQPAQIAAMFPGDSEIDKDYIGTERFVIVYTQGKE